MSLNSSKPRRRNPQALLLPLDVLLACLSMILALQVYYDMRPPEQLRQVWYTLPVLCVFTVTSLYLVGLYRSLMRYASVDTLAQIATGTLFGTGATYLFSLAVYTLYRASNIFLMPRPIYLIQWLLMMLMLGASRFGVRVMSQSGHAGRPFSRKRGRRMMIVGAGWAGAQVIREAQAGRYGEVQVMLAVDDDPAKRNTRINRVPVVMGTDRVKDYAQQYAIDEIIIAIATPQQDLAPLVHLCTETGCRVRMYAAPQEMTGSSAGKVRDVNIADLLGRAETHLDMTEVREAFAGRRVLVTGGGGSIGSELCRQLMEFVPSQLVLYDISENYIYDLYTELEEKYGAMVRNTVFLRIGSIRDTETLRQVFDEFRPEIVIHAAAHKHVPLMEDSPEQAIKNNVFGTYNVASCAVEHNVKRFVMISTDKAVNPTNIMGASKRLAEIIIEALQKKEKTQFTAVRFGNVLGSHGSVVPKWEHQIRAGGPITLTHPEIIRYFMTIPEAASLVLQAASIAKGGELFVLDMGKPVKMKDLAEKMIRLYADPAAPPVEIVYTGLRPGEKLYEELLRDEENDTATSKEKIFVAKPEQVEWEQVERMLSRLQECLEQHGDVRACIHELLPSFHEPEELNGRQIRIS
ncbi:MAG: polysaccharide biosynthesis protein [Christensenellaceae bacterium]|nr:polysaccharide biosynthesis protein [Christensenellaceae bacterium]